MPQAPDPEPIPLRFVKNLRDLGGYPFSRPDGTTGQTAFGVFLRSGSLWLLTSAGREVLRACGVRRVVDLRSAFELRYWPGPYLRHPDPEIAYTSVPMLDQMNVIADSGNLPESMFEIYRDLLDDDAQTITSVMRALDGPGCSLFHCRAGKDRTGVIAMLLLGLAGVDDDHIVEDYAASGEHMSPGKALQFVGLSILMRRRAPKSLFVAEPSQMRQALAHLHAHYGSAREYLLHHAGCEAEVLDRLTARLRGDA
ncbi:tyrosine-protein phosphatase [Collinsella sp. AGMB00827]|uniref:Tyrosine-protein phosphatase n=1 Tax=Collinsella ureilytica TaxID=2869515 RepID=A0ABS7MK26_9ACTN|nr:tyrosine-protein phosphatase [Collinsella urealyticum]MBY4797719.1 tyrosine-protein phosphatase [Collinsella urealyticum]